MRKGKFEKKGLSRNRRRTFGSKSLALVLSCVLLASGIVGGTLAWLTADSGSVTNTFTESDIDITLTETGAPNNEQSFKMVPGWTIDKDPKVTVNDGSEDCWLFVKITESTTPDLDAYIAYAIASGWETVQPEDENGVTVIGRKVYKDDDTKEFGILGAGTYTDSMVTDDTGDVTITWSDNQVCVKPSVTESMMADIASNQPTLAFKAYAVQLYKTNNVEFTAAEAWARAGSMSGT